jgi:hypothetical protein
MGIGDGVRGNLDATSRPIAPAIGFDLLRFAHREGLRVGVCVDWNQFGALRVASGVIRV